MTQQHQGARALPEQFDAVLETMEYIVTSYFTVGRLEQALHTLRAGQSLLELPEVPTAARARFLLCYGRMLTLKTQFENAPEDDAIELLQQARRLAKQADDPRLIADAVDSIGFAGYTAASNRHEGDPSLLQGYFQEALERRRDLQDQRGISESLFHLGLIEDIIDQPEQAHEYYTQSLHLAQQYNYAREAAEALRHLGFHAQREGNLSEAQRYFSESLRMAEMCGMQMYLPFAHVTLADVYLEQKELDRASEHARQALELAGRLDVKRAQIFALFSSGSICQARGETQQARDYYEQAHALAQTIGLGYAIQRASDALQHLPGGADNQLSANE
ncbi:hypothetical protein KDH_24630 [Dictyobacter sp. S3.2.2.5]|uniref:MalT-like TPR region domain-containing protein n=1 Tax=Dictyobacter halimunensis TaxID=3026934 RepID=A0ABQ6FN19_9CHLR|nr:hypothetical protein KDH_24630 [Dictyobacter sp. S3.2.2.5]